MVWCQRQLLLPLGPRYCLSSGWVPLWRVWRGSTQPAAFFATDGSVIPRRRRRVENKHTHRITKLFMLHIKYGKCHSFARNWSVSIYRFIPLALVEIDEAINYFIMVSYSSTQILSWRLKCTFIIVSRISICLAEFMFAVFKSKFTDLIENIKQFIN